MKRFCLTKPCAFPQNPKLKNYFLLQDHIFLYLRPGTGKRKNKAVQAQNQHEQGINQQGQAINQQGQGINQQAQGINQQG